MTMLKIILNKITLQTTVHFFLMEQKKNRWECLTCMHAYICVCVSGVCVHAGMHACMYVWHVSVPEWTQIGRILNVNYFHITHFCLCIMFQDMKLTGLKVDIAEWAKKKVKGSISLPRVAKISISISWFRLSKTIISQHRPLNRHTATDHSFLMYKVYQGISK